MFSIDTNILLHAFNEDSPNHEAAYGWNPLEADEAVEVIQTYRRHPRWRLIGFPLESGPMHDALWQRARHKNFTFRRLYDARSALTMMAQGVTEFATVNIRDYEGLGFRKVWNPLAAWA